MAVRFAPWLHALAAMLALALAGAAAAADRVALLIGNNQYAATPLRNAVNDAKDLGAALKELGFHVIVRENATRRDMIEGIREFGQALDGASTALFFYAGHAMQFKDRNYLIPIDAAMGSEEDVTFFSVEIGQIFDRMDRARTRFNFIILDACRDNPFAASFKTSSVGLAQMTSPTGTLIAYATAPGSVAADGFGRNGIYTKHILANIRTPDLPVEIMFKRVREGVERESLRLQTPWDSSSLKGDFVFNGTGKAAGAVAQAGNPSADSTLAIEREFWVSVRDSNRAEDIRAYLDKYPNGNFASLARNKLEALVRPTQVAAADAATSRTAAPAVAANNNHAAAPRPEPSPPAPAPGSAVAAAPGAAPPPSQAAPAPLAAPSAAPRPEVVAMAAPTAPRPAAPDAALAPASAAPPAAKPPPDPLPGREIAPGVREIVFADGAVYRGSVKGPNLHGRGQYTSKSFKYEGEFQNGLKHGQGTYTWENGDRYEGQFVEDRPDGKGLYRFANGDTYEGEVKAGVITGRGVYTTKAGDVFEGSFAEGRPHGVGIYRFASGDRYEGQMSHGAPHGKGRYLTAGGDRIEGQFEAGKPQGRGTYFFKNGDRYEGDLAGGALTGTGTYFYGTGLKYEGQIAEGRPQGKGVFWFLDGSRFEGIFEGGLARAHGEVVATDGTRAPAEIVDGNARLLK